MPTFLSITLAEYFAKLGINTDAGSYQLSGSTNTTTPTQNDIAWTWPNGLLDYLGTGLRLRGVVLQRSTTVSYMPEGTTVIYDANTLPFDSFTDPNWTNIYQPDKIAYRDAGFPSTFPDTTWDTSKPTAYRWLVRMTPNIGPIPVPAELCWNIVMVVPQQVFCFADPSNNCYPPNGQIPAGQRTLKWGAPDTSWWPSP